MNNETLKSAFLRAFSGAIDGSTGAGADLISFCHVDGTFVVDDLPYPLDKAGFADHRSFHDGGLWDKVRLSLVSLETQVHPTNDGAAGLIYGTYNLRGKPKDAGFRQRPGHFSAVCAWDDAANNWTALNIHFSPLLSQILDASPG